MTQVTYPADFSNTESPSGYAATPSEAGPVTPVPVQGEVQVRKVHGSVIVHEEAADFGAVFTITFTGTENPLNLLPYDVNRARAYITCTGTGPVWVSYRDPSGLQTMRNTGVTGGQTPTFILATGITLPVTHKQAVFISPDGTHSATVSVAVERWES